MALPTAFASPDALRRLPVPARPRVEPRDVLVPDGGWHEPGGPLFGPDGLMYFAQGSVSQNGVALPQGFFVDYARQPRVHDVPGQDVVLTGNNVDTYDPAAPFPFYVKTGPFKPF